MFNSKFFAAIALTAATIAPVATVNAATINDDSVTVQISYTDLDLTTPKGQNTLKSRVEIQVRKMCRSDERGLRGFNAEQECYSDVMNKARPIADRAIANAIASNDQ